MDCLDIGIGSFSVWKGGRGGRNIKQETVRKSYFEETESASDVSASSDVKVTSRASGFVMDDDYCGLTTPSRPVLRSTSVKIKISERSVVVSLGCAGCSLFDR